MSRMLRQVYAENVYVEFRFESSLRKYDKKPTKKIKCEAYCKHCIGHHRRTEESPRVGGGYRVRLGRGAENSLERQTEKSVISECKTIRLSKQKPPSPERKELNLLEMNVYRDLEVGKKKESEENSSSMEDEIFFNQFGQEGEEEENRDCVDKDFDGIEIGEKEGEGEKRGDEVAQTTSEKEVRERIEVEEGEEKVLEGVEPEIVEIAECLEKEEEMKVEQKVQPIIEQVLPIAEVPEPIIQLPDSEPEAQPIPSLEYQQPQSLAPSESFQPLAGPQQLHEGELGESMMDKCLLFQGGRIYVDTSGQNFYISVRVFNQLRRRYSSTGQLTSMLIHQRPCLSSKKAQIQHELQEYLRSLP